SGPMAAAFSRHSSAVKGTRRRIAAERLHQSFIGTSPLWRIASIRGTAGALALRSGADVPHRTEFVSTRRKDKTVRRDSISLTLTRSPARAKKVLDYSASL